MTYRPLNLHLVIARLSLLRPPQPRDLGPRLAAAAHLGVNVLAHGGNGGGALGLEVAVEGGDLGRGGGGLGEKRGELGGRDDGAEVGGEDKVRG